MENKMIKDKCIDISISFEIGNADSGCGNFYSCNTLDELDEILKEIREQVKLTLINGD
jgi:hypothetical protein